MKRFFSLYGNFVYSVVVGALFGLMVASMALPSTFLSIPLVPVFIVFGAIVGMAVHGIMWFAFNLVDREPIGEYKYPYPDPDPSHVPSAKLVAIWNDPAYVAKFNHVFGRA